MTVNACLVYFYTVMVLEKQNKTYHQECTKIRHLTLEYQKFPQTPSPVRREIPLPTSHPLAFLARLDSALAFGARPPTSTPGSSYEYWFDETLSATYAKDNGDHFLFRNSMIIF